MFATLFGTVSTLFYGRCRHGSDLRNAFDDITTTGRRPTSFFHMWSMLENICPALPLLWFPCSTCISIKVRTLKRLFSWLPLPLVWYCLFCWYNLFTIDTIICHISNNVYQPLIDKCVATDTMAMFILYLNCEYCEAGMTLHDLSPSLPVYGHWKLPIKDHQILDGMECSYNLSLIYPKLAFHCDILVKSFSGFPLNDWLILITDHWLANEWICTYETWDSVTIGNTHILSVVWKGYI